MVPVLMGIAPFAMVAGLAGVHSGFSVLQTAAFSALAYAGAAQIAACQLIGSGAAAVAAIATATIINLRFVIYSASLAPHFARARFRHRLLASYVLVDHAVALSLSEFEGSPSRSDKLAFYLGASSAFWATWQIFSLTGSLLGVLPALGIIAFTVPLSFLGLLAPLLREHAKAAAAGTSALVALLAHQMPANTGLLVATSLGLACGFAVRGRQDEGAQDE
jgi:predicted branched-subunit amino acid permease